MELSDGHRTDCDTTSDLLFGGQREESVRLIVTLLSRVCVTNMCQFLAASGIDRPQYISKKGILNFILCFDAASQILIFWILQWGLPKSSMTPLIHSRSRQEVPEFLYFFVHYVQGRSARSSSIQVIPIMKSICLLRGLNGSSSNVITW